MPPQQIRKGVYRIANKPATLSAVRGFKVHDEMIFRIEGKEYREWDPGSSKLSAAMMKGLQSFPFYENAKVLYLGAANGVTCSFISDLLGNGIIYAVEFSAQAARDLIGVCEKRENMLPIIEDARFPERYEAAIEGKVDVVYEDVSDRDQVRILVDNCGRFLKDGGTAMLAVKARSIDSTLPPKQIYAKAITELRNHFEIIEKIDLHPFERDHLFLVLKKR